MGTLSLVALDVNHIKQYVFTTGKLKEIRGASSRLDRFNRHGMGQLAWQLDAHVETIFANGGSGLFLMETAQAETFIKQMQQKCREMTGDAASVTCAIEKLPANAPENVDEMLRFHLKNTLTRLRYRLRMAKGYPSETLALTSHPFLRTCQSCGVLYAEDRDRTDAQDPGEEDDCFCQSCLFKCDEDMQVKKDILDYAPATLDKIRSPLWQKLLERLKELNYHFPTGVERPHDLNVFQGAAKNYIGLIYADANGMGKMLDKIARLDQLKTFAEAIDNALYKAVGVAITHHLPIEKFGLVNPDKTPAFPFDILMLGGDDVIMVTPADVALQVAQTLATQFYTLTNVNATDETEKHTLSVGVVLAPIKYPFSLLLTLVEDTLKAAKKSGSNAGVSKASSYRETRINFMSVTGSISESFQRMHTSLTQKDTDIEDSPVFYATVRPYTMEQFDFLLRAVREGNELGLGRTKLHQLREAILQKNLTTSVVDSLAVLNSWRTKQRNFVVRQIYEFEGKYRLHQYEENKPAALFPKVTFPWFADGTEGKRERYRTLLLDFVELYDFVAQEEGDLHGKG